MKISTNRNISAAILIGFFIVMIQCTRDQEVIEPIEEEEEEKEEDTTSTVSKCDTASITWTNYVDTLVQTKCATSSACHGSGSANGDYTSYSGFMTKIPEPFKTRVFDLKDMPPSGPLPQSTRDSLQMWLDQGNCE